MSAFPPGSSSSLGDVKAEPGRRYFSLRDQINVGIRYVELGFLFALPLCVAFFSKKYASIIIAIEATSYYLGMLTYEFDIWYNNRSSEKKVTEPTPPNSPTELETIIKRLEYFEDKLWISVPDMYLYLDANKIPCKDNLDWLEIVGLLNQLSLHIGKRFEESVEE